MATSTKQLDINTDKFIDVINKLADTDIVIKALNEYIPQSIKDTLKKIKK